MLIRVKANLDNLRAEIESFLESRGIAVFHGVSSGDEPPSVCWDTEAHADYRAFVAAAESAGVRLMALYANPFDEEVIDEALERLADSGLVGAERSAMERRLREMRRYDGATCQIELSFDHPPRIYVFDLRTDWFQELSDMLDEIDASRDQPEPPGHGYFSKN